MSWSRRFDEPIKTPDGKTLRTLQNAAEYVLALPPIYRKKSVGNVLPNALRTPRSVRRHGCGLPGQR